MSACTDPKYHDSGSAGRLVARRFTPWFRLGEEGVGVTFLNFKQEEEIPSAQMGKVGGSSWNAVERVAGWGHSSPLPSSARRMRRGAKGEGDRPPQSQRRLVVL